VDDSKKYIGFDLGAESGRCIVGVLTDNRLNLNEIHRFPTKNIKYAAGFYWDILAIHEEILKGLTLACERFGNQFSGISIDTWGVDYVLLDSENRILGYPFHYRDNRTDGVMEESFGLVSKESLYKKTGIQFIQFNTVFQLLAEKRSPANLLTIADKFLMIPDFLLFLLCGVKSGEYTIVSTTGLTDPERRDWAWELIDTYGLPRNIFPQIVEPGTILGKLLPDIAHKTGISENTPVIAGANHDTAAAVVSVPATSDHWAFLSSGTWSLMGKELPKPLITADALNYNFTNEGGVENTIRFLKNIIGLLPIQECRRYWQENGRDFSYAELARQAFDHGPANAWIDLNDFRLLKAIHWPEKIIQILRESGQEWKDNPGFIIRVIVESLAYTYRTKISDLEKVTGSKVDRLHAVGGGIKNELLTQLTADALNREVISGPVEGTTVGNIGVQAIATGVVSGLEPWRRIVANSFDMKIYQPQDPGYFDKNEGNYQRVIGKK
jgi:rhamnulokinase